MVIRNIAKIVGLFDKLVDLGALLGTIVHVLITLPYGQGLAIDGGVKNGAYFIFGAGQSIFVPSSIFHAALFLEWVVFASVVIAVAERLLAWLAQRQR